MAGFSGGAGGGGGLSVSSPAKSQSGSIKSGGQNVGYVVLKKTKLL